MINKIRGFTLFEIVIALVLISLILLGLNTMNIYTLRENQKASDESTADRQMQSLYECLIAVKKESIHDQIQTWNQQNQTLLPHGKGFVSGTYPYYKADLFWGRLKASPPCSETKLGRKTCLHLDIQLA